MKQASASLRALLASRSFAIGDLYTFSLVGGGVLRYTSYDTDIVYNGNTYVSGAQGGPFLDRRDNKAKCHWKLGLEVDTLVFDLVPGTATVNGTPLLPAIRQGLLDGAELELDRAFFPLPTSSVFPPVSVQPAIGVLVLFVGRVAEIDAGRSVATINVNSHLELLNQNLPRNLYQPGCVNTLGDPSCGVNLAGYGAFSTVSASFSPVLFQGTGIPQQADGFYALGKVTFTSGALNGLSRSIKQVSQTAGITDLLLTTPLPAAPMIGDGFIAFPGCDKSLGPNGCPKFNNVTNFRGFPFVPVPETAV